MCKEVEPLLDLLEAHISFPSVCVSGDRRKSCCDTSACDGEVLALKGGPFVRVNGKIFKMVQSNATP